MKQDALNYNPFTAELRKLGFKRDWIQKQTISNTGCVQYSKFTTWKREVKIQLWGDGRHRAMHMIYKDREHKHGRMSTKPTYFNSIEGMLVAIERERTRLDQTRPQFKASPAQSAATRYWQEQGEIRRTCAVFNNLLIRFGTINFQSTLDVIRENMLEEVRTKYEFAKAKLPPRDPLTTTRD